MDFKPLLAPIFVDAVRQAVTKEFEDAYELWSEKIPGTVAWKGKAKVTSPKRPSEVFVAPSALAHLPHISPTQLESLISGPANVPPQILVSYPPLALYLNELLTALNGLRLLAPIELYEDLLQALEASVAKAGATLLQYAKDRPWLADGKPANHEDEAKDNEVLQAVSSAFFAVLVPYVLRALSEGVYGKPVEPKSEELAAAKKEWTALHPPTS